MPGKPPKDREAVGRLLGELGFDEAFTAAVTRLLNTDYVCGRMLRYLQNARPRASEAVADELIALLEERSRAQQKQIEKHRERSKPVNELFLREIHLDWSNAENAEELSYAAAIPALRGLAKLTLHKNITFFAGENGTGKSTLLEAIAVTCGLNAEGGTLNYHFSTYRETENPLRLSLKRGPRRPKWSAFFRAESFYNVASAATERFSDFPGQMPDYHARSHGESFLEFIQSQSTVGLYLMDEPEAALSPQRQLTLLLHLHRMAAEGSQFLIATHSPILLGTPGAEILSFDGDGIAPVSYEETQSYQITKMFLEDRERVLRHLLE